MESRRGPTAGGLQGPQGPPGLRGLCAWGLPRRPSFEGGRGLPRALRNSRPPGVRPPQASHQTFSELQEPPGASSRLEAPPGFTRFWGAPNRLPSDNLRALRDCSRTLTRRFAAARGQDPSRRGPPGRRLKIWACQVEAYTRVFYIWPTRGSIRPFSIGSGLQGPPGASGMSGPNPGVFSEI